MLLKCVKPLLQVANAVTADGELEEESEEKDINMDIWSFIARAY